LHAVVPFGLALVVIVGSLEPAARLDVDRDVFRPFFAQQVGLAEQLVDGQPPAIYKSLAALHRRARCGFLLVAGGPGEVDEWSSETGNHIVLVEGSFFPEQLHEWTDRIA